MSPHSLKPDQAAKLCVPLANKYGVPAPNRQLVDIVKARISNHTLPLAARSNAGKMGASQVESREIPLARHDFPHYCRGIQLLMANPSSCAVLKRNSTEIPAPYRMIPHGWAFRPYPVS